MPHRDSIMSEARNLTLYNAAERMRRGTLTAEALTLSCLERIAERDGELRAWVHVDAEGAMERARLLDREAHEQRWHGPLHGIPVGIKDIIDVAGMDTRAGTEVYPARTAETDAEAVERLRKAGAVILGKTVTTPLAYLDPPPTANPWHPEHTPGGSSSGSAAAAIRPIETMASQASTGAARPRSPAP